MFTLRNCSGKNAALRSRVDLPEESHDRDLNAARNLLAYGLAAPNGSKASSAGWEACGELRHKKDSRKQEVSLVSD